MGYRKDVFDRIGGFDNISSTLSGDDDLLIQKAAEEGFKTGTIINDRSFVFTKSKKSYKEYFDQRARHLSASNYYGIRSKLVLAAWHIANIIILMSVFLIPVNTLYGLPFIFKLIADTFFTLSLQQKFSYKFIIFEIPFLQITYELIQIIHYINGSFKKIKWDKN